MFSLRRLEAETKTRSATIIDLQYADDAAIPTNSAEALQRNLDIMSDTYEKAGLSVSTRKTEVIYQPANPGNPADEFHFHINNSELPNVDNFTYLGSILNTSCNLDQEIQYRIRQATTSFGRLRDRVFLNRNLSVETKVMVYSSVCIAIHLMDVKLGQSIELIFVALKLFIFDLCRKSSALLGLIVCLMSPSYKLQKVLALNP